MPTTAPQESLSITTLITNASLPVQIIMLILLIMSILSWAVIITKWISISRSEREVKAFEDDFWNSKDLAGLHREVSNSNDGGGPTARIFSAGMDEYISAHRKQPAAAGDAEDRIEIPNRAMKATYFKETGSMDKGLNILASVGSVSPYIGLLGTVWGIMQSFLGLSTASQATLAAVAPGIAEALIATAIGLFAAIPAVLGYNFLTNKIDAISLRLESFMEEFLNILQRQGR